MIKAVEQCRDFCDLLVEGVKIQTTLTDDQWNNVFSNWLSSNYLAPSGVDFNIYKESTGNFIGFIETHGIKSNFYADNKLGFGIAYLLNDNLQLDFGTIFNFKETPTIFQMSLGVSYRLNLYRE